MMAFGLPSPDGKQHLQNLRQNSRLGDNHAVVAVARGPVPFHLKLWGSCWYYMQIYQAITSLSLDVADFLEQGPQITGLPGV